LEHGSAHPAAGKKVDRTRETEREMSSGIISYRGYVAGWLDVSLPDLLDSLEVSDDARWCLISVLDSNPQPGALRAKSPELRRVAKQGRTLGGGLLIPTQTLLDAHRESPILFGFDELWLFPSETIDAKPAESNLLGPARITSKRLKAAGPWMLENRCSLGLGGGEGVNFVVPARGLAGLLLGHTLTAPLPARTLV